MPNKSIKFDTGFKEYVINDDENKKIRINVSDINILKRLEEVQKRIEEKTEKHKDNDKQLTTEEFLELDKIVREEINYAFGNDICTTAFGGMNAMSPVSNGKFLFEVFLESLIPVLQEDMKAAVQAQNIHLEDKMEQYVSAAKSAPAAPQIAVATNPIPDISNLTQEQKDAMLIEMMRQTK